MQQLLEPDLLQTLISRFNKTVLRHNKTWQPRGHKTEPYHLCVISHIVPVSFTALIALFLHGLI